MGPLVEKSRQNLLAAEMLIKTGFHNSSVHCSYYAVVQVMLHMVFNKLGKSKAEFDSERRQKNEGSHTYADKLIRKELQNKSHEDYKWYQRAFPELKLIREEMDYTEKICGSEKSRQALQQSETLVNLIKANIK